MAKGQTIPRTDTPIDIGTLIDGRYRIDALLGHGTMGVVFRGRDLALDRSVAIKLIETGTRFDAVEARFEREARAIAQLRHENVVQVYALGDHDGHRFIAMEHIAGRGLDSIIDEHRSTNGFMPLPRAVRIIRRVCAGLAAVHAKGLIHHDIKPSNV